MSRFHVPLESSHFSKTNKKPFHIQLSFETFQFDSLYEHDRLLRKKCMPIRPKSATSVRVRLAKRGEPTSCKRSIRSFAVTRPEYAEEERQIPLCFYIILSRAWLKTRELWWLRTLREKIIQHIESQLWILFMKYGNFWQFLYTKM